MADLVEPARTWRRLVFFVPVLVFVGLAVAFAVGLTMNPREIPSVLIDQPVPEFHLPPVKGGRVAIDWGIYGLPETFVVDRHRVIRFKHVGPITPQVLEETILPLIEELRR